MKNFFVKSDSQKEKAMKAIENFGTDKISCLDAITGGRVPTHPDPYPYAESTFVKIIIPIEPLEPETKSDFYS